MSLGIRQHWRVLPQPDVVRGLSSIPRGFLVFASTRPCAFPSPRPRRCGAAQLTTSSVSLHSVKNSEPLSSPPASPSPSELLPPAAGLIDRLADVPVRHHGQWQSVLIPPATRYPSRWEVRAAERKRMAAVVRQEWLQSNRLKSNARAIADWREILSILIDTTPYYRPLNLTDHVKIVFPERTMHLLSNAGRPKLQSILSKSGCNIKFGYDPPHILITGTRNAVSVAVDQILHIENRVTVIARSGDTEEVVHNRTEPPSPVLWKEFEWGPSRRSAEAVRADQVPYPKLWTKETLKEYVRTLTTTQMRKSVERKLYKDKESHRHVVVEQLLRVFTEPAAIPAISLQAFKMALAYCTQENTTYTRAAQLFARVDDYRRVQFDSQTFNVLLEGATRAQDLVEFQNRLWQMVRRGLQPTLRTWILFLRLITSEEVRRHTLHVMNEKNLMVVPGAVALVAVEMAEMDAYRAVQLGQGQDFLTNQSKLYGPEWLTCYSANKVLDVFGRYGMWDEMLQVLELMCASESARPTEATVNIVITHSARQNQIKRTLQFLKLFETKGAPPPSQMVYDLLFQMAWRRGKLQMLSVIWRYALYAGRPTYGLLRRANYLLEGNQKALRLLRPLLPSEKRASAGALTLDPMMQQYVDSVLLWDFWRHNPLAKMQPLPGPRQATLEDVLEFYRWRRGKWGPAAPFSDILMDANRRDVDIWIKFWKQQRPPPLVPVEVPVQVREAWQAKQPTLTEAEANTSSVNEQGVPPDDQGQELPLRGDDVTDIEKNLPQPSKVGLDEPEVEGVVMRKIWNWEEKATEAESSRERRTPGVAKKQSYRFYYSGDIVDEGKTPSS